MLVALVVKNLTANAGDKIDTGFAGLGKSPGGGYGNTLQYSCLENPLDRGAWWATVHRVGHTESDTWKQLSIACIFYTHTCLPTPVEFHQRTGNILIFIYLFCWHLKQYFKSWDS